MFEDGVEELNGGSHNGSRGGVNVIVRNETWKAQER
jgi:hypothetical protein